MDDTRDEVDEILAGMTGGRTGTAGGVSSPVPPAADWARGLDAASASAARLTMLLSDVYRAHQGKEPSASLAAQIEQTVRNLTGEPPQEPEYGPGLWTAMPQRSWETMGMARPIDWTGAPSRTEIDLMTMHAIRYGEWLCRTFPTWEQTLPACWIEHDDVVAEVFALKCHADLAAASPNGGMYMPALMQDIHQALARVKEYLTAAGTGESSHAHHMDGEQHASRRRAREVEYESWYRRRGGWKTEPAFTGRWRGGEDFVSSTLLAYGTPPSPASHDDPSADVLMATLAGCEERLDGYRRSRDGIRRMPDGPERDRLSRQLAADTGGDLRELSDRWRDWRSMELAARDRLDQAIASIERRLDDRKAPLSHEEAEEARALASRGRALLDEAGDPRWNPDSYRPRDPDEELKLAKRLEGIARERDLDSLEQLDRLTATIRATIGPRGGMRP